MLLDYGLLLLRSSAARRHPPIPPTASLAPTLDVCLACHTFPTKSAALMPRKYKSVKEGIKELRVYR